MPIDLHRLIVFGHVAGMIGIVAGQTIEWFSVRTVMRATSAVIAATFRQSFTGPQLSGFDVLRLTFVTSAAFEPSLL